MAEGGNIGLALDSLLLAFGLFKFSDYNCKTGITQVIISIDFFDLYPN